MNIVQTCVVARRQCVHCWRYLKVHTNCQLIICLKVQKNTKKLRAVKATAMWSIGCIFVVLLLLALCRSVSALSSGNNKIGKAIINRVCAIVYTYMQWSDTLLTLFSDIVMYILACLFTIWKVMQSIQMHCRRYKTCRWICVV